MADPSKYRETFGHALYRAAGVPAPHTSLAEVWLTVSGQWDRELLGLYTIAEEPDQPFLRAAFGTDQGLWMKPEGLREFEDRGDDGTRYQKPYLPKREPTEAKRVIAFARLVQKSDDATFRQEIDSYLDVNGYLRFLATTFVANPDSFFVGEHNSLLYLHPTTGGLHILPWDLDRAFANLPIIGIADQQRNLSITRPYGGSHRLTERVLAIPGMTDRYRALVKELTATGFAKEKLLADLTAAEIAMKAVRERDAKAAQTRKEGGPPGGFGSGRPPSLLTFVAKRTASVAAQLAGTSKGHVPSGGFGPGAFKLGDALAGPMMESLDIDKDGTLSRNEWVSIAKRLAEVSDKDANGQVVADGERELAEVDKLLTNLAKQETALPKQMLEP